MSRRETFEFKLTYFKESGKYYSDGKVNWEVRTWSDHESLIPFMYDAVDLVKESRILKTPLPGLSGTWDGPVLIDCEQGYPCLVMPEKKP